MAASSTAYAEFRDVAELDVEVEADVPVRVKEPWMETRSHSPAHARAGGRARLPAGRAAASAFAAGRAAHHDAPGTFTTFVVSAVRDGTGGRAGCFCATTVVNGANINTAAAVTSLEISGDTATVTADCGDETCTVVLHGHSREKPRPGRVPGAGGLRFDQHGTGAEDEIVVQTG